MKFSHFKACSRSKYSSACFSDCQEGFHSSVWYLSSQSIHHVFQNCFTSLLQKKCSKISGQWQIMKSRLQTWSKHCRLISAFYLLLLWLWVKMCRKWWLFFPELFCFWNSFCRQFLFLVKGTCLKSAPGVFHLVVVIVYSHYWQLWIQVICVTFEKKGGVILECMSVLLLFEICMKLLPIDWNKMPFFQNASGFSWYFSVQWHLTWRLTTCD